MPVLPPSFRFYSLSADGVESTSFKVETTVRLGGSGLSLLPGAVLSLSLSFLICMKGVALSTVQGDEGSC